MNLDKSASLGTINDLIERYLAEYCMVNNRDMRGKRNRCRTISRLVGTVPIQNMSPAHVTMFIARRRRDGVKASSINRDLEVVYHMMKWASKQRITEGYLLEGCDKVKSPQWEGRKPDQAAVDAVFAELPPQVIPFFTFLLETGCRRGEALNLRRGDVDYQKRSACFRETKIGKPRRVRLTTAAMAAVQALPASPLTDHVFYNPITLRAWYGCENTWNRARKRAGVPWLRIHDLRKYFGIRLAEDGCEMHFIQSALGHKSVTTTEKYYAQFSPDSAGQAVLERLENMAARGQKGHKTGTEDN